MTDSEYSHALAYVMKNAIPQLPPKALTTFRRRWTGAVVKMTTGRVPQYGGGNASIELYKDKRQVVPESAKTQVLKTMWFDPKYGGTGKMRFWEHVVERYYGISQADVSQFMDNLESYQLHRPIPVSGTISPIKANKPFDLIQVDLIDMSKYSWANNGYTFILTIIDAFTKRCWAFPLKNKEGPTVTEVMKGWLATVPQITQVQSDNGSEFKFSGYVELLKSKGIKQVYSVPAAPQSQGLVENRNGVIKRMLHQYFTLYNQTVWVDILPMIVQNINNSKHAVTKMTPLQAQQPKRAEAVQHRIQADAEKRLAEQPRYPPLGIGDTVRIAVTTDVNVRKDTFRKSYLNQWSPELYQVVTYIPPAHLTGPKFMVKDSKGNKLNRMFFRFQLQKVDPANMIPLATTRPQFDANFKSRVEHARNLHTHVGTRKYTLPKTTLQQDFQTRTPRNPGVPSRFADGFFQ